MLSDATIARIILMRRFLEERLARKEHFVFSHEIAKHIHASSASVRRDLMTIGFTGSPKRGYDIEELLKKTIDLIESREGQRAALIGIGNLGRALLSFFPGRLPRLEIVAGFDVNPEKFDRILHGCKVYPMARLAEILREQRVSIGIITVPAAAAQDVADELVASGVRGILNFAPAKLRLPAGIFVENLDVTMSLEKVAYFAAQQKHSREKGTDEHERN